MKTLDLNFYCRQVSRRTLLSIPKDKFVQLGRALPSLEMLFIGEVELARFTTKEIADKPLFPSVSTFTYRRGASAHRNQLQNLLYMIPNINSIELDTHFDENRKIKRSIEPLSTCPSLKSLNCFAKELFRDPKKLLIPQSSLRDLESITINNEHYKMKPIYIIALFNLIPIFSSTLVEFTLDDRVDIVFESFKHHLSTLTSLKSLNINLVSIPIDFLQLVPDTLQCLKTGILVEHLKHLHLHPRPFLHLVTVSFSYIEGGVIEFLPEFVSKVQIHQLEDDRPDMGDVELLFGELRKYGCKSLREILVWTVVLDANEEEQQSIHDEFTDLGITLENYYWQSRL